MPIFISTLNAKKAASFFETKLIYLYYLGNTKYSIHKSKYILYKKTTFIVYITIIYIYYYSYNKVNFFPKKTTLFFNNDSKFQLQSKNPIRFGHNRRGSITNIDYRMIRSLGQRFRENLGDSLSFVYIFQQVNYPPGKKVRSLSARGPFDSLFPLGVRAKPYGQESI